MQNDHETVSFKLSAMLNHFMNSMWGEDRQALSYKLFLALF